jgi:hypothetical protein
VRSAIFRQLKVRVWGRHIAEVGFRELIAWLRSLCPSLALFAERLQPRANWRWKNCTECCEGRTVQKHSHVLVLAVTICQATLTLNN